MIKKIKIQTCIIAFITLITTSFGLSYSLINSDEFLRNFKIIKVTNTSTNYHIEFEEVPAAVNYEIIIYDEDSKQIYNNTIETNTIDINLTNIEYDKKYKIMVYAYDKLGNSSVINNPYEFIYVEPTFSSKNDLVLNNNQDKTININGNLNTDNYEIALIKENTEIYKEQVTSNFYTIKNNYFKDNIGQYELKIFKDESEISKINLYNEISPVSDINITSPQNNQTLDYGDITITFDGGENASEYILEIYKDNLLIKQITIDDNKAILSSEFFQKDTTYTIKIIAKYLDYSNNTKESSVSFKVNEKETLKPTYINYNPNYVTLNSSIILTNPNKSGTIYYTTDGTEPTENSLIYSEPIKAKTNMIIKTIVKENNKNDSIISTYNINIAQKKNYKVYLSPSNQDQNFGISSVGYTNEMKEMNDLSNYIEQKLEDYGIKVYRNNPNGNINLWTAESLSYGADLHIAIHSNASTNHTSKGIETWINEQTSETYSLANIIQADLMSIYYDQENGNRGVKYSNGVLGETRIPKFGILVEVAHHDNLEDARWIMNNKKIIGETIANSILKYYGIIS